MMRLPTAAWMAISNNCSVSFAETLHQPPTDGVRPVLMHDQTERVDHLSRYPDVKTHESTRFVVLEFVVQARIAAALVLSKS